MKPLKFHRLMIRITITGPTRKKVSVISSGEICSAVA